MIKQILILILILTLKSLQAQECEDLIMNYFSQIDTTERKVVLIAEEMPSIFKDNSLFNKLSKEIKSYDLSCCPIYVWYAFIVETDGTLSNIMICPQFMYCDSPDIIDENTKILTDQFNEVFSKIKTKPGKINNKPVAVANISKIHYECFDWNFDIE